jgi:hypothetical protein
MSARSFVLNKRRQGNITVNIENDVTYVRLHGHLVASKNEFNEVYLSSCGYRTNTTKTAINRFLGLTAMPYFVSQKKGVWYLHNLKSGTSELFQDGMTLNLSPLEAALA